MKNLIFLNDYFQKEYGHKVYKLSLNGGMTCPNRDGTKGTGGCIFCSSGGSGEFAGDKNLSIREQIEGQKNLLKNKIKNFESIKFISYFQAFTNTYAPVDKLETLYRESLAPSDVVGLSIATRPDVLPDEVLELLKKLKKETGKEIWVELGLQTIHEKTAEYIRRGYRLECFNKAVEELHKRDIKVIVHIIFGLPGETEKDMLATVSHVGKMSVFGVKFQNLQILKGTDLAKEYVKGLVKPITFDEYGKILIKAVSILPEGTVIHRITGDPPKSLIIEPEWCTDKRLVMDRLKKMLYNS
ncbi:MAG: TIGR01212 family radical SAM protein [Ruminococcaceae bacterium]|nr:TIGR01212 family radical SAM protein [Oscillospiraceae bacterium]